MTQKIRLRSTLRIVLILLVACMVPFNAALASDQAAAFIANLQGSAWLVRDGKSQKLTTGSDLLPGDIVETSRNGTVGLVFSDESRVSLGPHSRLKIQEYWFAPEESKLACVLSLFKGTAVYVSGIIAKLSTTATKFITPTASIGIRGTRFAVQVAEG